MKKQTAKDKNVDFDSNFIAVDLKDIPSFDVDISLVDRNPNQPRKTFLDESLTEMANSIKKYGIIQPILVAPAPNGRYFIVAGERRFRSAHIAGLKKIPVIVRDLSQLQIKEIALIENLHREDLNAIESAEAVRELMDNHGLTQEEVAQRIGKSRPYVANIIRLLQLPKEIKELVKNGSLSAGHARALISIDDKAYLMSLAKQIIEKKMSVREVENLVRLYFAKKENKTKSKVLPIELKEFVNDLKRIFSTKVSIVGNSEKGRISIDYYNKDDLDRIFDLIQSLKK